MAINILNNGKIDSSSVGSYLNLNTKHSLIPQAAQEA
jgi:hypothetical protein